VLEQLERGAVADLQLELAGLVAERMDLQAALVTHYWLLPAYYY
jgi:hypothetical protein